MNRRNLFSFFAAAPVGVAAAITLKPSPAEAMPPQARIIWADLEHRCKCGSGLYYPNPNTCVWCRRPYRGE